MKEPVRKGMEAYQLYDGDQVTVGVTHEISIDRDKSWVKYEAKTRVRPGESGEDAATRAVGHVNESVMRAVTETVERVRGVS